MLPILWALSLGICGRVQANKHRQLIALENRNEHNTRQAANVFIRRTDSDIEKQTINFKIAKEWNSLPTWLKETTYSSQDAFKRTIKSYILNSYKLDCEKQKCYVCQNKNG